MATDKSLSIRQVKATEELGSAITQIKESLARLEARMEEIVAAQASLSKLQAASRALDNKKG
jgi:hypothetical protein